MRTPDGVVSRAVIVLMKSPFGRSVIDPSRISTVDVSLCPNSKGVAFPFTDARPYDPVSDRGGAMVRSPEQATRPAAAANKTTCRMRPPILICPRQRAEGQDPGSRRGGRGTNAPSVPAVPDFYPAGWS